MEYLQYFEGFVILYDLCIQSFKPCYKWNTFNTKQKPLSQKEVEAVLNLVISGIPSILNMRRIEKLFNKAVVLNLVISGIPSIPAWNKKGIRLLFP